METSLTTKEGIKITQYHISHRSKTPYKIIIENKGKINVINDKNEIKQFKRDLFEIGIQKIIKE